MLRCFAETGLTEGQKTFSSSQPLGHLASVNWSCFRGLPVRLDAIRVQRMKQMSFSGILLTPAAFSHIHTQVCSSEFSLPRWRAVPVQDMVNWGVLQTLLLCLPEPMLKAHVHALWGCSQGRGRWLGASISLQVPATTHLDSVAQYHPVIMCIKSHCEEEMGLNGYFSVAYTAVCAQPPSWVNPDAFKYLESFPVLPTVRHGCKLCTTCGLAGRRFVLCFIFQWYFEGSCIGLCWAGCYSV